MTIGENTNYNGTDYTAVAYKMHPAELSPNQGDPQCRICQLAPNLCEMHDECHSSRPFIFVKSDILKAMAAAI